MPGILEQFVERLHCGRRVSILHRIDPNERKRLGHVSTGTRRVLLDPRGDVRSVANLDQRVAPSWVYKALEVPPVGERVNARNTRQLRESKDCRLFVFNVCLGLTDGITVLARILDRRDVGLQEPEGFRRENSAPSFREAVQGADRLTTPSISRCAFPVKGRLDHVAVRVDKALSCNVQALRNLLGAEAFAV